MSFHLSSGSFFIFARSLLHVLWPASCPVCGKLGESICASCLDGLAQMPISVCLECGTGEPCALHPNGPYCRAVSRYDAVNRHVVHAMKYRNARRVATMMGQRIARSIAPPDADCLVPVPLHKGSERDYNQACLIAQGAGEVWGIPVRQVLAWHGNVSRQARAGGAEERFLPKDAIIVSGNLSGCRRACLVDDVRTTGNTLCAARVALEREGCGVAGAVVWSMS
ncbi:double zinc ribbon domain-containing protein [Synergistaceae bacterium OttesenSCG-928-I11]|nr:double zinc ribbon domain-containing protein [Synergistaceae bacterium OttesenSCG-928-I11]